MDRRCILHYGIFGSGFNFRHSEDNEVLDEMVVRNEVFIIFNLNLVLGKQLCLGFVSFMSWELG